MLGPNRTRVWYTLSTLVGNRHQLHSFGDGAGLDQRGGGVVGGDPRRGPDALEKSLYVGGGQSVMDTVPRERDGEDARRVRYPGYPAQR